MRWIAALWREWWTPSRELSHIVGRHKHGLCQWLTLRRKGGELLAGWTHYRDEATLLEARYALEWATRVNGWTERRSRP